MLNKKLKKIGYSLKDVSIVQAPIGEISHRSEVNPFITVCNREVYPIFVSPMASVTDEKNYNIWIKNKVTPVIPRSIARSEYNKSGLNFFDRLKLSKKTFVSFGLEEAKNILSQFPFEEPHYICIDIANGTLKSLYKLCKSLKHVHGDNCVIMTGNVANPKAYREYVRARIDYMRVSIGTGSRCTTACNTGTYYPAATLLDELAQKKRLFKHLFGIIDIFLPKSRKMSSKLPKLILDGGISNFDDIQKAIALGADAVMAGNIFARAEEACGKVLYADSINDVMNGLYYEESDNINKDEYKKFREYYGMSTKRAQKETGGVGNKTAEGISRPVEIEYPISKWIDNMASFLRSNMTYTNSYTISDLQKVDVILLGGSGDFQYRK